MSPTWKRSCRQSRADFLATQENLQTAIEELNSTNEEFQAANEELQSANEELQSTNEELYSVNTEFERTNNELKQLNVEHANLLNSIESGIVLLDRQMCIRKFNPAISSIFKLLTPGHWSPPRRHRLSIAQPGCDAGRGPGCSEKRCPD